MKYQIIEEIDGVGSTVFYAAFEVKGMFGRTRMATVYDSMHMRDRKFTSSAEAKTYLKRHYAEKTVRVVEEGIL